MTRQHRTSAPSRGSRCQSCGRRLPDGSWHSPTAGVTRRLTRVSARVSACRAPPPPSTSLPPSKTSAAKPTAPARGLGDPLAGVTPAQVIGTVRDAPSTGSLQAAGRLERMMSGGTAPPPGPGARTAPPQGAAAAASIPDAIKAAVETCAEETGPACAAAWDEVEELSQHVSRKKQDV